jgi:hypothetical protein
MLCHKCGNKFPAKIVIDGIQKNLSSRKYCLTCSPFGTHNTRKIEEETKVCIDCGKGTKRGNICNSCQSVRYRIRIKKKVVELLGGKCTYCGYDKCIQALQCHHINPKEKNFTISGSTKSWEEIKREALKCELVCANCHIEIHTNKVVPR